MYTVYMHITPNNKRYIGITKLSVEERWCNGSNYRKQYFGRAIKKYGWNNIKHIILFKNLTKQQAEEKEINLIRTFNTTNPKYGYNIDNGGHHIGKHSEITKEKLRKSHLGKKASEETKEKHRLLALKQWEDRKNKHITYKVNYARKGVFNGRRKTIPVICIETNKQFETIKDASIYYKICDETIRKCIHKERNTAGGYHWKELNIYD